jgi:cytochrome bd-type quinol oxidase subunit 1
MFSTGQWIFAGFFVVAFVILMIFSYRKDKPLHKKHYKGSFLVLLGFFAFFMLLLAMKFLLKQ